MSCGMWPEMNTLPGAFIRLLGPPLIVIPVRLELGPERWAVTTTGLFSKLCDSHILQASEADWDCCWGGRWRGVCHLRGGLQHAHPGSANLEGKAQTSCLVSNILTSQAASVFPDKLLISFPLPRCVKALLYFSWHNYWRHLRNCNFGCYQGKEKLLCQAFMSLSHTPPATPLLQTWRGQ